MRSFLFAAILALALLPIHAYAKVDQRCFSESACIAARKQILPDLTDEDSRAGFVPAAQNPQILDACAKDKNLKGERMGFCLPAGKTRTNISFGGKQEFENIGEFIKFGYRYIFAIAGIVGVIMIIIAGVQWTLSGGSSDAISKAQKRIANAMIGLTILALSYSLLNFVNPALVNFRLPQVWLVNTQGLAATYCGDIPDTRLELLGPQDQVVNDAKRQEKYGNATFAVQSSAAECGNDYLVEDSGAQTCSGTVCPAGLTCYRRLTGTKDTCNQASMGGLIYNGNLLAKIQDIQSRLVLDTLTGKEEWEWNWANEPEIYAVCADGSYHIAHHSYRNDPDDDINEKNFVQEFAVKVSEDEIRSLVNGCTELEGLKGFVLSLDMNEHGIGADQDERHFIGMIKSAREAVDLGDKINSDADYLLKIAKPDFFVSENELLQGVHFNVNAGMVYDIDEGDDDRNKYYEPLGYKR